jgi:hypothetical protein
MFVQKQRLINNISKVKASGGSAAPFGSLATTTAASSQPYRKMVEFSKAFPPRTEGIAHTVKPPDVVLFGDNDT